MPRQQTLEASIAWSHDLLSPPEQVLLRRLSVFVGGCTLDDAEAVVADEQLPQGDVLDVLDRLVAQSVDATRHDGGRYQVLETVRQYGVDANPTCPCETTLAGQERHAHHCRDPVTWTAQFGPELDGRGDIAAFARLVADIDNIRATLDHLVDTTRWNDLRQNRLGVRPAVEGSFAPSGGHIPARPELLTRAPSSEQQLSQPQM